MPAHDALRDSIEAEIIRRLQALAPRHRAVLDGILLAEGDPRKIKGRTWHALARDFKRELYGTLIWAAHGAAVGNWVDLGAPDLNDPGEGLQPEDRPSLIGIDLPPLSRSVEVTLRRWCDARASAVADGMVRTAIKQLELLRSDLRGRVTEARRSPAKRRKAKAKAKARRQARKKAAKRKPPQRPDASGASELFDRQPQYAELLDKLYGDDRWRLIAQTETTGSIVAGEVAILRTLEKNRGWRFDMLWKTQVDELRCPICRPLHNKHRAYFARRVGFPPAHPRCRCYLSYRVLSKPKGSPGVSRKAATKMPATGVTRRRRKPQKKSA